MQNTVNQAYGDYRGNIFHKSQNFRTDNTVNQANGIYSGNIFNGKKRSIHTAMKNFKQNLEMEA